MPSKFGKRVFFGHQSVGSNILDGVHAGFPDISTIDLDSEPTSNLRTGVFHARIGKNGDPQSKFDSFRDHVLSAQREYDLALMKLCYIDFDRRSDIDEILTQYVGMVERLQIDRPNTEIVHITVPLRTLRLGVRSYVRKWTGRRVELIEDNLRRHSYNESLRQYFGQPYRVFDLAKLESTTSSGDRCDMEYRGAAVPSLMSAYSTDGGHLNELGRSVIAREFVSMIRAA